MKLGVLIDPSYENIERAKQWLYNKVDSKYFATISRFSLDGEIDSFCIKNNNYCSIFEYTSNRIENFVTNRIFVDQLDKLVVFWGGKDKYVWDCVSLAIAKRIPVLIYYQNKILNIVKEKPFEMGSDILLVPSVQDGTISTELLQNIKAKYSGAISEYKKYSDSTFLYSMSKDLVLAFCPYRVEYTRQINLHMFLDNLYNTLNILIPDYQSKAIPPASRITVAALTSDLTLEASIIALITRTVVYNSPLKFNKVLYYYE